MLQERRTDGRRQPSFVRRRILAGMAALVVIVIVVALALGSGGLPAPPLPGIDKPPRPGDPFAYSTQRQTAFEARATAGSTQVLFTKSPGGVIATAARVAAYRGLIDQAARGSGVDPDTLEALVFLESAGRPDVIAGSGDPSAAAGLTQILASTGQSMLGMHIDLQRSRALSVAIGRAAASGNSRELATLQQTRARADDRFDPARALAATVRYLRLARARFARGDLAVESYHMGIGNLQQVLDDYDAGTPVPYAQLYFDSAPDHHGAAWQLLSSFGDDSSLYFWRVLGARSIMHLYRRDRPALVRLSALETAFPSTAEVLHPPDRTPSFADPAALDRAYLRGRILPLPRNAGALGLAYDPSMGSLARRLGAPRSLYRGLRPAALDLLIELASRVQTLSGQNVPLIVSSAAMDRRYARLLGFGDPPATTGYTFTLRRSYASHAQAIALQAMLDRLQALNLIGWIRGNSTIEVTVAADAAQAIVNGP
ncbi:MAG: transglycosylase SLT domain-containing protein [Solirubrobacteraceae bacterium]